MRGARPGDVPALRQIFQAAAWSNVEDRPLLTEHPEFLDWDGVAAFEGRTQVAVVEDHVVGFVSSVEREETIEIEDLFVDPEWMRRGVASTLVDHVVARAREAGRRRVVVDANTHALAFYRRAAFVDQFEVQLEHGTAIRMHRDVSA